MSEVVLVTPGPEPEPEPGPEPSEIAEATEAAAEAAEAAAEAAEAVAEAVEAVAEAVEAVANDDDGEEQHAWQAAHAEHEMRLAAHDERVALVESRLEAVELALTERPEATEVVQAVPQPDLTPAQEEALAEAETGQNGSFWQKLGRWL